MTEQTPKTHRFEADVSQVLSLVVNSLYSHKEIFLRELISNASDALDKLRFRALSDKSLTADDPDLRIRLIPDREAGTLTVWDNGIGMDEADLVENLGTVAHSGSRAFLDQMRQIKEGGNDDLNLIGQFGVGFYSAFLVADRVEVVSRAAGADQAWRWLSDAKETYTVSPAERGVRGTSVILHLKEDDKEFLNGWRLRQLVERYSDFVGHPIELRKERPSTEGEDEETPPEFEVVNRASALWRRPSDQIDEEQYAELYKHISRDWEPPLTHTHFTIEGTHLFTGLLFIPKRRPFDLFLPDYQRGLRLYVKRVFIMDEAEALLPVWLRFVRGVVDSDDLPLNISRETLQDSRAVAFIRKQVIRKVLDLLEEMAARDNEKYLEFWDQFGPVLKEGLHFDATYADRLAKLVRFTSSTHEGPTSLAAYVERMKEGQPAIYYAIGPTRTLLEQSPHLEALTQRGYEVLFLTDPVDQWAIEGLPEFDDKPLVSIMHADVDLGAQEKEEGAEEAASESSNIKPLIDTMSEVLSDRVAEIKTSRRLTQSPACLVIPEGGVPAHIERLLRARQPEVPSQKRILEVNPDHAILQGMNHLLERDGITDRLRSWIEVIYDQALLVEGSPIDEPARFAKILNELLEGAVTEATAAN